MPASAAPALARYPNALASAACPPLAGAGPAIQIACDAKVSSHGPFIVAGTFRIGAEDAPVSTPILGDQPHRSLVLVVWREPFYHASTPFRDLVLFPDDVTATPAGQIGHFHFDVLAHSRFNAPGTWYLAVSLHVHHSNTLAVEVR